MTTHIYGVDLENEEQVRNWALQNSKDALAKIPQMILFDSVAFPVEEKEWNELSVDTIKRLFNEPAKETVRVYSGSQQYMTYAVRTWQNRFGLLRVAAISEEKPRSMSFEFKLLNKAAMTEMLSGSGVLSFHIVTNKNQVGKFGQMMSEGQIADYLIKLNTYGPDYPNAPKDVYRWFKISENCTLPSEAIMADYKKQKYVLLCNWRPRAMLSGPRYPENWHLTKVETVKDASGRPAVRFELDEVGQEGMATLTGGIHIGLSMAIVLNDNVIAAPRIQSQLSKQGMIVGNFTDQQAEQIADTLRKYMLPVVNPDVQVEGENRTGEQANSGAGENLQKLSVQVEGEKESSDQDTKEVFLPDEDISPVALRLASGKLLQVPDVNNANLASAINELGVDLAYASNETGDSKGLVFLRGATADKQLYYLKSQNLNVYEIGRDLPEVLVVTTSEGARYVVEILSADKYGCRLKYHRLDKPDVQVEGERVSKASVGAIDVAIEDFKIRPYLEGGLYSVVVSIRNKGDRVSPKFGVYFYRDYPDKKKPMTHGAGPIKPGDIWNEVSMPFALKEGVNELWVVIDPHDKVAESDETNNRAHMRVSLRQGIIVEKHVVLTRTKYRPIPENPDVQVEGEEIKTEIQKLVKGFWTVVIAKDWQAVNEYSEIDILKQRAGALEHVLAEAGAERKRALSRGMNISQIDEVYVKGKEAIAIGPANKERFQWYYLQKRADRWVIKLFDDAPPHLSVQDIFFKCRSVDKLVLMGERLTIYAAEHQGKLPENLEVLEPYILDKRLRAWLRKHVEYLGKGKEMEKMPSSIVAYTKTLVSKDENTSVLFNDGSVTFDLTKKFRNKQPDVQVEVVEREVGAMSVIRAVDNKATLRSSLTVELLGLTEMPIKDNPWWKPNGSVLEQPPFDNVSSDPSRDPNHGQFAYYAIAMKLNGKSPDKIGLIKWDFTDAVYAGTTSAYRGEKRVYAEGICAAAAKFPKDIETTTLRLGIASGDWQTLVAGRHYGFYRKGEDSIVVRTPERVGGPFGVRPEEKGLHISVTYNITDRDFRVVAVDKKGKVHFSSRGGSSGTDNLRRTTASFPDLTRDKLQEYRFQVRPHEWVEFKDISLRPGKEAVALTEKRRAAGREELEKWLGQGQTRRIREQILVLRGCRIFKEMEAWASAIRELVSIGKPAVPELLAELRRAQRWPTQSTVAFTLRAIADPCAVPVLIEVLGRVEYRGEYGIHLKDPPLSVFMLENQHRPAPDRGRKQKDPQITIGCPVIEITAALEKITGHTEGHEHYGHKAVAELGGDAPHKEWQQRVQEIVREVANRWQKWWDQNKDAVMSG